MRIVSSLLAFSFAFAAGPLLAIAQPDTIGLYFDAEGTQSTLTESVAPGETTERSIFAIVRNLTHDMAGYEFGSTFQYGLGVTIIASNYGPGNLNVGDPPLVNQIVGTAGCVEPLDELILVSYTVLIGANVEMNICLTGSRPSSSPDNSPMYVTCERPLGTELIELSLEGTGCLSINTTASVENTNASWSGVKARF